jgi:hypothetical protein
MIIHKLFEKNTRGWSFSDYIKLVSYLVKYGYIFHQYKQELFKDKQLSKAELASVLDSVELGIDKLKEFLDLHSELEVLKVLDLPRCSVPDFQTLPASNRKWGIKTLTYYIEKRDTDLSPEVWDATIDKALKNWSAVADLKFNRVNSSNANIIVSVGRGRSSGFDGPNGTLAWAQLPPSSNYKGTLLTKADADEKWIVSGSNGIRLENVMCHEFGHILGLDHSNIRTALMAPIYSPNVPVPQSRDDISRIVSLYGLPKNNPTPIPQPEPTPEPLPEQNPNSPSEVTVIEIHGKIQNIHIPGYRVNRIN